MVLTRSQQMARIRGKDTSPERVLRSALWAVGLRYRVHDTAPIGRPDILFPTSRVAVFIDGCFWHGCPHHYVRPRTREGFWSEKLRTNVERDRRQTLHLESGGWRVVRIWEHEVEQDLDLMVARVRRALSEPIWPPREDLRVVQVRGGIGPTEDWILHPLRFPRKKRRERRTRNPRREK